MSDPESDGSQTVQNRECSGATLPLCGDGGSDLNRFFEALGDERRRRVLIYLQQNETCSLQDVARFLADYEDVGRRSEDFKRLRVDLVHLHLPKLADHGLLAFDNRTNTVSYESLPTAVERILDITADLEETDDIDRSSDE